MNCGVLLKQSNSKLVKENVHDFLLITKLNIIKNVKQIWIFKNIFLKLSRYKKKPMGI